jgi:hypothetical protein
MTNVRNALYALRAAVQAETARAEKETARKDAVDAAQAALAGIAGQRGVHVTAMENAITAIRSLEASTGVTMLGPDGKPAKMYVGADGKLVYDAASVSGSTAAIEAFRASGFWSTGGLQDQLLSASRLVNSFDTVLEAARKAVRDAGGVPAFAGGGWHGGGLRIVGERGPEIEATGPARYYSNAQTRQMLAGGDMAAEIRALRDEVARMREEQRSLGMTQATAARRSQEILRRWEDAGLPQERA